MTKIVDNVGEISADHILWTITFISKHALQTVQSYSYHYSFIGWVQNRKMQYKINIYYNKDIAGCLTLLQHFDTACQHNHLKAALHFAILLHFVLLHLSNAVEFLIL